MQQKKHKLTFVLCNSEFLNNVWWLFSNSVYFDSMSDTEVAFWKNNKNNK